MTLLWKKKDGVKSKDAVNGIKTGLMGTIRSSWRLNLWIIGASYYGFNRGNFGCCRKPSSIFLWIAVAVAYDIFRWKQLEFAYKEGVNLINNMQSTLTALIDAASVLGVFMVGALIASMIGVEVSWAPTHRGQSN